VAGWPELDSKRLWELGFDLLMSVIQLGGVINQSADRSRQQVFEVMKPIREIDRLRKQ